MAKVFCLGNLEGFPYGHEHRQSRRVRFTRRLATRRDTNLAASPSTPRSAESSDMPRAELVEGLSASGCGEMRAGQLYKIGSLERDTSAGCDNRYFDLASGVRRTENEDHSSPKHRSQKHRSPKNDTGAKCKARNRSQQMQDVRELPVLGSNCAFSYRSLLSMI